MRLLYRAQSSKIDDDLSSPARRLRPQGRRFVACVLSLGLSTLANVVAAGIRPDPENPHDAFANRADSLARFRS